MAYPGVARLFVRTFNDVPNGRVARGPFSCNVYEAKNLSVTPVQRTLVTNTTALTVQLPAKEGEHYFRVTCVDTNTGLDSLLVNR